MTATPTRDELLDRLRQGRTWDVIVIGGGASGLGAAVDAAARGYLTLLLERGDYACGTSSRSTKLIHGGVRYLRQGDLALVRHALIERSRLLANAPHLVHALPFVIPAASRWQQWFYGSGLKLYDLLAGANNLTPSCLLDRQQTLAALPTLNGNRLAGGIQYWDAQFDDARLAIALMRTADELGATCLNYCPVDGLLDEAGRVAGVKAHDAESGERFTLSARVVINATGVYSDAVRRQENSSAPALLTPSQGIHLVVDGSFLPGEAALMIPETADGRVMFAIPWQGKVLLGTTDTPRPDLPEEPRPLAGEIDFLLDTAAGVLARPPRRADIRSVFAGLRPLLHPESAGPGGTASLSREHAVLVSPGGLVTVAGGKWTTYRLMAEQVVDRAAEIGGLAPVACTTAGLTLHQAETGEFDLTGHNHYLNPGLELNEASVRHAIRYEAARTVDDILARRNRAFFLDTAAAQACIPSVLAILADELALPQQRQDQLFAKAASVLRNFIPEGGE